MSGILIVYCSFMYLLAGGMFVAGLLDKRSNRYMFANFIFAPVSTPVLLGFLIYTSN